MHIANLSILNSKCIYVLLLLFSHYIMSDSFVTPWTSLSDFSVYGISQARISEWVAISFSRGSSSPRDQNQTCVSSIVGGFATSQLCVYVCVCIHQEYKNIKPPTRFSLQYLIPIEEQHLKKQENIMGRNDSLNLTRTNTHVRIIRKEH